MKNFKGISGYGVNVKHRMLDYGKVLGLYRELGFISLDKVRSVLPTTNKELINLIEGECGFYVEDILRTIIAKAQTAQMQEFDITTETTLIDLLEAQDSGFVDEGSIEATYLYYPYRPVWIMTLTEINADEHDIQNAIEKILKPYLNNDVKLNFVEINTGYTE